MRKGRGITYRFVRTSASSHGNAAKRRVSLGPCPDRRRAISKEEAIVKRAGYRIGTAVGVALLACFAVVAPARATLRANYVYMGDVPNYCQSYAAICAQVVDISAWSTTDARGTPILGAAVPHDSNGSGFTAMCNENSVLKTGYEDLSGTRYVFAEIETSPMPDSGTWNESCDTGFWRYTWIAQNGN